LPRILHLPTGPAMEPRVAPILASFGGSVSQAPGCPVSLLLQFRLSMRLRVAPTPASSGLPTAGLRVSPNFDLPASLGLRLRVAPIPAPSGLPRDEPPGFPGALSLGGAFKWISGFPRISHPPAVPLLRLRSAPNPASTAGPTMTPRLDSNFASSVLGRG